MDDLIGPRNLGEHDNEVDITLLHHGPEVVHCVGKWSLGSYVEPLAVSHSSRYMTRIHVAKLVVLLIQDLYPVLIIRNNIFEPDTIKYDSNKNNLTITDLFLGKFSGRIATEVLQLEVFFLGIFSNSWTTSPSASLDSKILLIDSFGILDGSLNAVPL